MLRTPPARVSRRVGEAVTAAIQDRIFDNTTFANGLAKGTAAITRGGHVFAEAIERSRHQPPEGCNFSVSAVTRHDVGPAG